METQELNTGIIFTNEHCIGCNKCLSGCPVVGANVVVHEESDKYTVSVDPNKCILCGNCIDLCHHFARTYHDDTDAFFDALMEGEDITILVSPTLLTDYEKQYHNILGYLKACGVNHIYNTGFGADLMVWAHMNFVLNFGRAQVISQSCPVIVNYLEKYRPELLQYLLPVQSPLMCTAICVRDYLNIDDKIAYISPCIASKYEISDRNTYGMVNYNVTFKRLMERIENLNISECYAEDELTYGLGALISTTGGHSENIKQYIGFDEVLIHTSGPTNIFPYFDHYYYKEVKGARGELPFLVEAFSCTDGCNFGTGTNCGYEMRNEMSFSAHRARENAFRSGKAIKAPTCEARMEKLNERFKEFELSSFVRQYNNVGRLENTIVSEETIQEIYLSMYKDTDEKCCTDCGSCGNRTCRDMAYSIATNVNYKENCINYSKEYIRRETEKTKQLLIEISIMNDELKKSTQLKSNFLANMSHEIRTPMNAIIGMAEMAMRGELPMQEMGYLQQIKASGRSLLAIINDILDFSKIESGKMEINCGEYTVMSIINDTVNIVMTRIGEKDITLVVEADPEIPLMLEGDDIRVKQILVNLANNAVKFTQEGCVEIKLGCEQIGEDVMLQVSVRDTGVGITPEDQKKLFTSFQQVDSKRNRNIEGTGLGLAISQELVELMNGKIKVESTYGEGSTFSFSIPQKVISNEVSVRLNNEDIVETISLIDNKYMMDSFEKAITKFNVNNIAFQSITDVDPEMTSRSEFFFVEYCFWGPEMDLFARENPGTQFVVIMDPRKDILSSEYDYVYKLNVPIYCLNIAAVLNREIDSAYQNDMSTEEIRFEAPDAKILVVDDNGINLTVAKGLLAPMNMNVFTASSGMEAVRMIEQEQFDIVFMDHMMPEIDGVEATHLIRQKEDDYFKQLPIIALTANAINNAKEMFLQEGMNDFVAKPIDMKDITSKLRKWLPSEKIRNIGGNKQESKGEDKSDLRIEGLDVDTAMALSGTRELYEAVLSDYYTAIEKKANSIETFEAEGDLEAYTIEVHALKSASKLVGAMELSELAAMLEQCGKERDVETIGEKTPELLTRYRAYLPILKPYGPKEAEETAGILSKEDLTEKLEQIYTALDDFDIDNAMSLSQELGTHSFDEEGTNFRSQLLDAVNAMEYDEAADVAQQWKESVQ